MSDADHFIDVQNEVNGIRQRKQYVFKRQRTSVAPNNSSDVPVDPRSFDMPKPTISFTSACGSTDLRRSLVTQASDTQSQRLEQNFGPTVGAFSDRSSVIGRLETPLEKPVPHTAHEPRRFHLSRTSTSQNPADELSSKAQGGKGNPTIFIEQRRPKSKAATSKRDDTESGQSAVEQHILNNLSAEAPSLTSGTQQQSPAPLRNTRLPSGKVIPWYAETSQLAAEMEAYTMQEIGHNLSEISRLAPAPLPGPILKPKQVCKLKPKPQAPRYYESPEQAVSTIEKQNSRKDEAMTDPGDPEGDESGYVMDTYIRMPAEMFELENHKSIGVLVLDSQPDIDEFYNDDSDSDSEIFDEEEDENGLLPQSTNKI